MKYSFEFRPDARELLVHVGGHADIGGFREYLRALRSDPRMEGVEKVLIDLRGVTRIGVTLSQVMDLAESQRGKTRGVRKSALLVSGRLTWGIARQFGTYADDEGGPLRGVFDDEAEAWGWLRAPR